MSRDTKPDMRRTTYTAGRTSSVFCPQPGDRIYSISYAPISFAPGDGIVTDIIHTTSSVTFFTKDGAALTVNHGAQILWSKA